MSIAEFSVRRPVFMSMVYALLIIVSIVFIPKLDQAIFPSVDLPYMIIYASCGDADPESIEMQVTRVLENSVSGTENLKNISSYSQTGRSIIQLEFAYGSDLDKLESDVSSKVSMVNRLMPSWVSSVNTMQVSSILASQAFMTLSVDGNYPVEELKNIASNTIEPLLARVKGVGDIDISGAGDIQYNIEVNPNRLAGYGLTMAQIVSAVSAQNNMGSGGKITSGSKDYTVMTDNRYSNIGEISDTRIGVSGGKPVYVKDVADVIKTTAKGQAISYFNGNPTVMINLYEASDTSVSTVAKNVRNSLNSIRNNLPEGVSLNIRRDNSKNITAVINETISSLFWGVLLAAIVIFLFLVDFKSTFIISLSMPVCVVFTLMLMAICKISVNMVSMSGLILGIGMIVDASIVILENITNYRLEGETAPAAAILGSKNMFTAIVASTLTTICVFLPVIIFMNDLEMVGQMMKDLVFTICFSLVCSLFVSVTLVPALAGAIMPIKTTTQREHRGFMKLLDDFAKRVMAGLEKGYGNVLTFFLAYKRFLLIPIVLLMFLSISLFSHMGFSMMPSSAQGDSIALSLTLPTGTTSAVTEKYVFEMQDIVMKKLPEGSYDSIMSRISDNTGTITIMLPDLSSQTIKAPALRNMIRDDLTRDATAIWTYSSGQRMGRHAVDVEISAENMDQMYDISNQVAEALRTYASSSLTNVSSDLTGGAPRLKVVVDKARADLFGVTPSQVSGALLTAITGSKATEISTFSSTDTYDLYVKVADEFMSDSTALNSLLLPTSYGNIRLDSIATLSEDSSPTRITRENKVRISHVTADALEGFSSSDASKLAKSVVDSHVMIPKGAKVKMHGDFEQFSDLIVPLILVVVLAIVLVFGVMAAQFESLINPFIIFATIPLLLIGVSAIHFFTKTDFSILSIIGVVALVGVVVNNGIVLVDAISREIRDYGTPVIEACVKCSQSRLRPILMTTITTVAGMAIMAFFPGTGAQQMQPIALTFVGGITVGAFLTLFLSPVLFAVFNRNLAKRLADPNSRASQIKAFEGRIRH